MFNKIAFYPTPIEIVDIMISLSNNLHLKVLDTGFGKRAFLDRLIQLNKTKQITGIELDLEFFNEAFDLYQNRNIKLINNDYLNYDFKNKFNLIIGNPPYITNDTLNSIIKSKIKELTTSGEGNIYYAFIIKSIELLEEDGELIYIVPYDFFYNTYAQYLRHKLIEEGEFEIIIDLGDLNIFKNAAPETIIFKWIKRKNKNNNKITIYKNHLKVKKEQKIKDLFNIFENKIDNDSFKYFEIEQFKLKDNIWTLSNIKTIKNGVKLGSIATIGVGIVNGLEQVFLIDKIKVNNFNEVEKENCLKYFIKAKDLYENNIEEDNLNLYIYISNDEKNENEFKNKYPNVYNYLYQFKTLLSKRYLSNSLNWFNYSGIRNLKLMENSRNKYKIIVPHITRKKAKWFSLTNSNHYIGGDVLFLICKNDEETIKLFNYLNSSSFEKYYIEKGPRKGNRIIFSQNILKEFVIEKIF